MSGHHRPMSHVDTTLTKVFIGGLAWETTSEALHQHFSRYGDISEAVVIDDRHSGKSRGYGFVTFEEPEAARKATIDSSPIIDNRKTNCIMAAKGARKRLSGMIVTTQRHQWSCFSAHPIVVLIVIENYNDEFGVINHRTFTIGRLQKYHGLPSSLHSLCANAVWFASH